MEVNQLFTWRPIFEEIAKRLVNFQDKNEELAAILSEMHAKGLKASPNLDQDADGNRFPLKEMDPFTFLAIFNRGIKDSNRVSLLDFIKSKWGLASPLPTDFAGIPIANPMKSWFMPYQSGRTQQHIPTLWRFFVHALSLADYSQLDTALFDECCALNGVKPTNLTMGMFWARPSTWLALDWKNVQVAERLGVGSKPSNGAEYVRWLAKAKGRIKEDFVEFSHNAHLEVNDSTFVLASPYDKLFRNRKHADDVLNSLLRVIEQLIGQTGERDLRLATTIRKLSGRRYVIRVNFGPWLVFSFRGTDGDSFEYQIVLPETHPLIAEEDDDQFFAEKIDGVRYAPVWIEESEFLKDAANLWPAIQEFLAKARGRFSQWEATPYSIHHDSTIYELITEPETRDDLLQTELKPTDTVPPAKTSEPEYWLIAPGQAAKYWNDWRTEGVVTVGWNDVGDLNKLASKDEIGAAIQESYPDTGVNAVASMLWDFSRAIRPGDIVFAKQGISKILGWGVVTGEYKYDSTREYHHHSRRVDWRSNKPTAIPDGMILPQKALTPMSGKAEFIDHMIGAYGDFGRKPGTGTPPPAEATIRHWWLNANPAQWDPRSHEIGAEEGYTAYNENGNPRRLPQAFQQARRGDRILIYLTSPLRILWGLATVTKSLSETENKEVRFVIDQALKTTVPLETLQADPSLEKCIPLFNHQGSLFPLHAEEFNTIVRLSDTDQGGPAPIQRYTLEDALKDLFIEKSRIETMVRLIRTKHNIVLQGAPGTGKTFVAKRLAHLLMGESDESRVMMVQFHQSTSYEDFVQGYRPDGKNGFTLRNGTFFDFCRRAMLSPDRPFVFIIDEINRGNLSKILGELMMLIESDKRNPSFAIPLSYAANSEETFFVPDNVYLIGTMNTADRSLSMVDYALRRRFAFIELSPEFESPTFAATLLQAGASPELIAQIRNRMHSINELIAEDSVNLGRGFRIGHSFFVPNGTVEPNAEWLEAIIDYEIAPLLDEYWVDDEKSLTEARRRAKGEP